MVSKKKNSRAHPPLTFVVQDHPYILAFSLIMLHTDAFNKSNKNKMTKADYVKNTKLPGIPPEILEVGLFVDPLFDLIDPSL